MSKAKGASAETTSIAIGTKDEKIKFEFPRRYAEGHTCSAIEARQLDRTLAENISNNVRKAVQATLNGDADALTEEGIQEFVLDYASDYEFTIASIGAGTLTPVERAARKIARDAIVAEMRDKKGLLVKDMDDDQKKWLSDYVVEISEREAIIELAEAEVAAKANAAAAVLAGLDLDAVAA